MHQDFLTYKECDSAYYEAMRINKGSSSGWSADKEGNALIDTDRTDLNIEIVPHHPALNPSDYRKHNRGQGLAEHHKKECGRSARMKGDKKQQSKVVGCIGTFPREEYIKIGVNPNLTDEEWRALENGIEKESKKAQKSEAYKRAIEKLKKVEFTPEQRQYIIDYLTAACRSWQKNAGIKDEDILFAVIHFDESTCHFHICAYPSAERTVVDKETGKETVKKTFSTERFTNWKTGYMDTMHQNVIKLMQEDYGIDGSNLLNGSTKKENAMLFSPANLTKEQREESLEYYLISREAERRAKEAEANVKAFEEEKGFVENEIKGLEVIKNQEVEKVKEIATAIDNGLKKEADIQNRLEASKTAYEGFKKEQGEEMNEFFEYRSNQAKYKAKKEEAVAKLEAKEQRIQNQCVRLEGQRDALKEDVKELAKEIGDVGSITRAVHNISNTEKEVQNYDDMTLFARVAMNFLERKFPKILQEILNIIEKARGISARKNIIETMQKEAEADVKAIEEEWDLDR